MAPWGESRFACDPGAKPADSDRCRKGVEDPSRNGAIALFGKVRGRSIEMGVDLRRLVAERSEVLDDPGILNLKHRQDLVPNPYPFEHANMIRRVVDEGERAFVRVRADGFAPAIDQRPDHPVFTTRGDAAQAADTCTAEHASEHGLRLVVLGVADGDAGGRARYNHPVTWLPDMA